MNLSAAASSTKPSETLSVFIQAPALGIELKRPGTSESATNGIAIVAPKVAIPSAMRERLAPSPVAPTDRRLPTKGAVQVKLVITSVAPIRNTPTRPPRLDAFPAAFIRKAGGSRRIAPNSTSAK